MRDTDYATELGHVSLPDGDGEVRIERLRIKSSGEEEIRFSWWKEGRLIPRPLDLPEAQLLELMRRAAKNGVFTPHFAAMLRDALAPLAKGGNA
jgi:hypothetical protein